MYGLCCANCVENAEVDDAKNVLGRVSNYMKYGAYVYRSLLLTCMVSGREEDNSKSITH